MAKTIAATSKFRLRLPPWLALFLLCMLVSPVFVYAMGHWITGPYEGGFGVLGFLFSIYADALRGKLAALVFLSAPAVLIAIWVLRKRFLKLVLRPRKAHG